MDFQGVTSVVFVGNPGAGKSTLHNALGGSFKAGFSPVLGMSVGEPQEVLCDGRPLRLVDLPGVNDHSTAQDIENGESAIDRNLKTIQTQLNSGDHYVIFFVIALNRSGAIPDGDIRVMRVFFQNLQRGPRIGLIITQVHKNCLNKVTPSYVTETLNRAVTAVLNRAGAKLPPFQDSHVLLLTQHELHFSDIDCKSIRRFILSFTPSQVHVRDMTMVTLDSNLVERNMEQELHQLLQGSTGQVQRSLITVQRLHLKYLTTQLRAGLPENGQFYGQVFCFGQAGVGKSTVTSALDYNGNPNRGFPRYKDVILDGKRLYLVDDLFPVNLPTNRTLLFFIISPRNGRIDPTDVVLLQHLLNNIRKGPKVGVIFTQVRHLDYQEMQTAKYFSLFVEQLHSSSQQFLETTRHLTLTGHDKCFSDQEKTLIQNFVLSFEPKTTEITYSSILPPTPTGPRAQVGPVAPVDPIGKKKSFWRRLF